MALDPKYIAARELQQHFTDKDTGDFLRNGYVLFYKDNARTVGKPVYQLVGTPGNYSYVPYGFMQMDGSWRVDLNMQGAFDFTPYYYPYDDEGNIELYFVQVFSTDVPIIGPPSILQFSREAVPPGVTETGGGGTVVDVNYVPNGQFLLHTNLPKSDTYEVNEIREPITQIAYGGWTFERPIGSTSKDFVEFTRFGSAVVNPQNNPRYALRVFCESPNAGDSFKDVRLKYDDVNKFASTLSTVEFTFSFWAQTNAGGSINVSLILYKDYGTGGSTPTETTIKNFTITNSYQQYTAAFSFGDNISKTIGQLDDDYLQLILRFPTDTVFDASVDDFILTDGNVSLPIFPNTPNSQFKYRSVAGFMPVPAYDSSDLYLPLRLTPSGLEFDHSDVGKIVAAMYETPKIGELLCDGAQYETSAYSPDGIPYSRLQKVLFDTTLNMPICGTGADFVTSQPVNSVTQILRISTNKIAVVSPISDGTPATGFTFSTIYPSSPTYYAKGIYVGGDSLYIKNEQSGNSNYGTAGDSGFTVLVYRTGSNFLTQILQITTVAAAGLASKYFTFNTMNANVNQSYYMWFTVDGVGTDPAPGGTGIKVELKSTFDATEVARIISLVVSGYEVSDVQMVGGNLIPPGSYFNIFTELQEYYVWYKVDGAGTDPKPVNKLPIEVNILSTDADTAVSTKTQIAINSRYFATPDTRDMFLRGFNPINDPVSGTSRYSNNPVIYGNIICTEQFDEILQHAHELYDANGVGSGGYLVGNAFQNIGTGLTGGAETRPINMYVNYMIKY